MSIMKKPSVMGKFHNFFNAVHKNGNKIGTQLRVLELVYSNACIFNCKHCSTRAPLGENSVNLMPIDKVASLAKEADELGIYEWNFHGGELLINKPRLLELIKAVDPNKFYMYLTSNGYLLDRETAFNLAEAGIDRVSVSIDSLDANIHDNFRGQPGALERALNALEYVKEAGMAPFMNITVGHYNAFSEDVENMLKYSKDHGYTTLVNIAIPTGNWRGNLEVVINDKDRAHLIELRQKYGNVLRDLWDPFDKEKKDCLGCQTMSKLYITPSGDVLPCSFMNIKIGNVYDQSLKEIVEFGYSIRYFREHSEKCLAGEDLDFIKKYMQDENMSVMHPLDAHKVFKDEIIG